MVSSPFSFLFIQLGLAFILAILYNSFMINTIKRSELYEKK